MNLMNAAQNGITWIAARAVLLVTRSTDRCMKTGERLEAMQLRESALACYQRAVGLDVAHARAHFCIGNIYLDRGDARAASAAYHKALELKPDSHACAYNLGNAHLMLGEFDAAFRWLALAVHIKPDFADAHFAIGHAHRMSNAPIEALQSYRKAVELSPGSIPKRLELADLALTMGFNEEAAESYKDVIAHDNQHVDAHLNLGAALKSMGNYDQANHYLMEALRLDPRSAGAYNNIGAIHLAQGQIGEAAKAYKKALEINADLLQSITGLASCHIVLGEWSLAEKLSRDAITLAPNQSVAHGCLATVLNCTKRYSDALTHSLTAISLNPREVPNLLTLSNIYKDTGQIHEALNVLERLIDMDALYVKAHHNRLFIEHYTSDIDPVTKFQHAQEFGRLFTSLAKPYTSWRDTGNQNRGLRIGFLSGEFGAHPVGYFLLEVLRALKTLYSDRLTLVALSARSYGDTMEAQLQSVFDEWYVVQGLSDQQTAKLIHGNHVDILLDLSGHSGESRLPVLAWRPAPVQVNWLGYFGTTGLSAVDYVIADPWTLTQQEERNFTETVWRLPKTRLCFSEPSAAVAVNDLPAAKNGYVTFACFNNFSKVHDGVLDVWCRILKEVPNSRLLIKANLIGDQPQRLKIVEQFEAREVPETRLILEDSEPRDAYLLAHHRVDIQLDPFPYTGGTTTVESLWMGVPVLTLAGDSFIARQGVGLLVNAGLEDWIAKDKDDYVHKAFNAAKNLAALQTLRSDLRKQVLASPLFDSNQFAQHFEQALRGMWHRWCDKQASAK